MRRDYLGGQLSEAAVADDPLEQLDAWLHDAEQAGLAEPNAMVLATSTPDGRPSVRTVLLKGRDHGLRFFTNHGSQKGRDLTANPHAAVVFPWHPMERQLRASGPVERLGVAEDEAYFRSRPRGAQLGAWASEQSSVIAARAVLDERLAELERRWPPGTPVPLPQFWGGYRLVPLVVELWQGRPSRLHDRLRYSRLGVDEPWSIERLAP